METTNLFSFIKSAPTAFHAVDAVRRALEREGFSELCEQTAWSPVEGGKYYTVRNGSSLIAFVYRANAGGFMITAAHTDSPTFRVKLSEERTLSSYTGLDVERYGGMIYYTWFDRPLSVAGRVVVRTETGLATVLVNVDRDLLTIPSVAIHLRRDVNDGFKPNPAVDLLPLFSSASPSRHLLDLVAEAAGVTADRIVSHDLFLYVRDEGRVFGEKGDLVLCPRLDDLACVYGCLRGFLGATPTDAMPVLALFDNEEVGSSTKQGAASTFLCDTLSRIGGERYREMVASSFMVSADNAHARHPNHPELSDAQNAPVLNGGVVIKFNANQKYATDAVSDAIFRSICDRAQIATQNYYNRADLPGGSTLGSIADTVVSLPTVDIGIAQLAMHAAVETCGAADVETFVRAMTAFYSASVHRDGDTVRFD